MIWVNTCTGANWNPSWTFKFATCWLLWFDQLLWDCLISFITFDYFGKDQLFSFVPWRPSLCFCALGKSVSCMIWHFLDFDQIGTIGAFLDSNIFNGTNFFQRWRCAWKLSIQKVNSYEPRYYCSCLKSWTKLLDQDGGKHFRREPLDLPSRGLVWERAGWERHFYLFYFSLWLFCILWLSPQVIGYLERGTAVQKFCAKLKPERKTMLVITMHQRPFCELWASGQRLLDTLCGLFEPPRQVRRELMLIVWQRALSGKNSFDGSVDIRWDQVRVSVDH